MCGFERREETFVRIYFGDGFFESSIVYIASPATEL